MFTDKYGRVEEDPKRSRLFLICNPASRVGRQVAYIHLWDTTQSRVTRSATVDESLSALAVRDDGRFLAVGTMFTGSVSIYIAFSLQRVLNVKEAHSMFVTGLEFLPAVSEETSITTVSEAAVISISVDNRVCIHNLPYRPTSYRRVDAPFSRYKVERENPFAQFNGQSEIRALHRQLILTTRYLHTRISLTTATICHTMCCVIGLA
ncbi:hypothetical protein J6590_106074 [Homalodisca vitripennis]|nr:hypothetical protein J6590_106074 [Homalodisca vitripennis]